MKAANVLSLLVCLGIAGTASAEGPVNYPDLPELVSSKTRAEVSGDYLEARRQGLVSVGDAEMPIKVAEVVSTKTRDQVKAELAEAQRLGLMIPRGEADAPIATDEDERQIAEAGLRANERQSIAGQ
jgi:hypothetical protein